MQRLALYLSFSPVVMKRILSFIVCSLLLTHAYPQVVGTSPLEYNPVKYYQHFDQIIDREAKSLYPLCGTQFYVQDTLSLPFVDDFSQNHFTTYHSWDWLPPFDSIARTYRLTPDTFAADTQLFKYSLLPTKHYTFTFDTVNSIDSSIINIPRQLILYGNCENPFIPTDTLTVYAITSPKYYWDTLTLTVQPLIIFPDGTLNGDTIDTIQVYNPIVNSNLWVDNFVYRNTTMGVNPPTYGVATFDGTNEFGKAYAPGASNSYGVADYLTSKPIDLSVGDSIFLSFFSQPKGLGYRPDDQDSLVLEFYSPQTSQWYWMWSNIGDTLSGDTCRAFIQSIIPVNNPIFLQKGFQFRFKNWGNLSGNLDHWNLDYVRLDSSRTAGDLIIDDIAFVYLPPTILNNYTAMPYRQFTLADRKSKWNNYISNLYTFQKSMTYLYDFRNEAGTLLNQYPTNYTVPLADTSTIDPYNPNGYSTYQVWAEPDFNYNFSGAPTFPFTDTARFRINHYLYSMTTDVNKENDSITLNQDFLNYYSYDDGTAEEAVWLGTPGYMTVKFTNNFPDTLRGIQFYFSPIKDDVNSRFITLQVYTGSISNPTLIYQDSRQVGVQDTDPDGHINKINNGFTTYLFTDTIIPLPAGDFFVGWYQGQTFKLNVGFDKNINTNSKTYYKTSGVWDTLTLPGTLMIRPMVGPALTKDQIGIEEYFTSDQIILYPNPAAEIISFSTNENVTISGINIIDLAGKMVYQSPSVQSNQVDVSTFAPGIYFMQFFAEGSPLPVTKKFIKSR